jgi:hypothetical protein
MIISIKISNNNFSYDENISSIYDNTIITNLWIFKCFEDRIFINTINQIIEMIYYITINNFTVYSNNKYYKT